MNKKGFSLVELLAIITILALIIGISTMAISGIQKRVLTQQSENNLKNILIKAEDYAHQNGFNNNIDITVQTLIDKGQITTEEDGTIKDPLTKKVMNCYVITVTYTENRDENGMPLPSTYKAQIKEEKECS